MVQALICAPDWLKPSTKLDIDYYFEELQNLGKGNVLNFLFHFLICLFTIFNYLYVLTYNFYSLYCCRFRFM